MTRRRRRRGLAVGGLLVALIALGLLATLERRLVPVLSVMAQKQAEIIGVDTLSRSLSRHIGDEIAYQDLILLQHDRQGQIVFMQVNTTTINRLVADLQLAMQRDLQAMGPSQLEIPLGAAFGSRLLAAYGPRLKIRVIPLGTVRVTLDQDFAHAGINQTRHTIYLSAQTEVRVVVPLHKDNVVVQTRTPLVEAIIVGPVPRQYLNLNWSSLPWSDPEQNTARPVNGRDGQSDAARPAIPPRGLLLPAPFRR